MIESFRLKPKISMIYCVDEQGIPEADEFAKGKLKRKGFLIKVEKLFKWKSLPVAKVIFCDCEQFAASLDKDPRNTNLRKEHDHLISLYRKIQVLDVDQKVRGS